MVVAAAVVPCVSAAGGVRRVRSPEPKENHDDDDAASESSRVVMAKPLGLRDRTGVPVPDPGAEWNTSWCRDEEDVAREGAREANGEERPVTESWHWPYFSRIGLAGE